MYLSYVTICDYTYLNVTYKLGHYFLRTESILDGISRAQIHKMTYHA